MPGAPQNPFYAAQQSPPAYNHPANRPAPPPRPTGAPTTYGSLADLTRGNAKTPSAPPAVPIERPTSTSGWFGRQQQSEGETRTGRHVPPPVGGGHTATPPPPPRRDIHTERTSSGRTTTTSSASTAPATSSGYSSYIPASAQGYANTAGGYLSSAGSKAKDGFDTVVNQQTKDQVLSGAGKVAGGAIKLGGKAVWSAGKFVVNAGNR